MFTYAYAFLQCAHLRWRVKLLPESNPGLISAPVSLAAFTISGYELKLACCLTIVSAYTTCAGDKPTALVVASLGPVAASSS
jgi:hypothetical protein